MKKGDFLPVVIVLFKDYCLKKSEDVLNRTMNLGCSS